MKIDLLLLPRGQNSSSYYLYDEFKHNILAMNLNPMNIVALVGKANKQKESGGKRVLTSQKHDGKSPSPTRDSAKKK
jgi:hypothetical protein